MDFIDFDSFSENDNLPQPQPALSLPISSNIENLGKKISNFNSITRTLLKFEEDQELSDELDISQENKLAEKYVHLSLNLIEKENEASEPEEDIIGNNGPKMSTLSTRLSRVLNSSLSDTQIRDMFGHLEDKLSENSNEMEELIEPGILGSLSRKKLRGKIEEELIKNQGLILKEYQPIIKQLKNLDERVSSLNEINKLTNEKINKNFKSSNELNTQIKQLNDDKKLINLKKNLLTSFKRKFTLNEYEEYVLMNGEINDEFFQVLTKVEIINENCSILLSIDNPQLGLKIMSKINQLINKANERIINFTNKTLSNLYSLNTKLRIITLHKCLRYLKNKLNYFNSVITSFTDSRSKHLIEEFLNQINVDSESLNSLSKKNRSLSISSDQSSRPIYVSAHDPVRFIGDLLAYVHSVVVNESETITSIFTIEEFETDEELQEYKMIMNDIVEKVLKSLSRPIKSKIEQIISAETKLSTIYSIYNLVELYTLILSKQLTKESDLLNTIKELVTSSQEKIINIIGNRLATIRTSNSAQLELNLDLQPPEWILQFYSDILPIVDQITSDTILNLPEEENRSFMDLIINEPINIFNSHVENNKLLDNKRDKLILTQNFLDLIISKIMPITLLSDKVLEINDLINELTLELTDYQFDNLLQAYKLSDFYNIVNMICPFNDDFFEVSIYQPITENKLFNNEKIKQLNEIIQKFLPNALIEIQESLLKLNSPLIANDIITDSSIQFIKFYQKFNLITEEYLQEQFTWSDIEIATLLGVEQAYSDVRSSITYD